MRRLISLLIMLTLLVSTMSAVLAAPVGGTKVGSDIVKRLSVTPSVVMAGGEITVSADLNLPHQPKLLTMTFTEEGQQPRDISVCLTRADDGSYGGTLIAPDIIARTNSYAISQIAYTVTDYLGERDVRFYLDNPQASFRLQRHQAYLTSWDLPSSGEAGDQIVMSFTFKEPLPFRGEVRAIFAKRDNPIFSFQTEALKGEGAIYTAEALLPTTLGDYLFQGFRVGPDLHLPLSAERPLITVTPYEGAQPQITGLELFDSGIEKQIALTVQHPESVADLRVLIQGPYHYLQWLKAIRGDAGDFFIDLSCLELPHTGTYAVTRVMLANRQGNVIELSQAEIAQWGIPAWFSNASPSPLLPQPTHPHLHLTQVAVEQKDPTRYRLTTNITGADIAETAILNFTGNGTSFNAICRYSPETSLWEGNLDIPSWARSGNYRLTSASSDTGMTVTLSTVAEVEHVAVSPDTTPPHLLSVISSAWLSSLEIQVYVKDNQSGVRSVVLLYENAKTGATMQIGMGAGEGERIAISRQLIPAEKGNWVLVRVDLTDMAGNTRRLQGRDFSQFPFAQFIY